MACVRPIGPEPRQLTVLSCGLAAPEALAARLESEARRAAVEAFHRIAEGCIERCEARHVRHVADGVLALFGYPADCEDHAEQAVRAGLGIVDALALEEPTRCVGERAALRACVGIATGTVVDDEGPDQESACMEQAAVAETARLATCLRALAEPGAVVVGPVTARLVRGSFEQTDLGLHRLQGLVTPVRAWRIEEQRASKRPPEVASGSDASPTAGRTRELGLLWRQWLRATDGEGQVVLLTGEAGIGKSHLARALRARLRTEPHFFLRYDCSPYHRDTALHPFTEQLARAAEFTPQDDATRKVEKLKALLSKGMSYHPDDVGLFASLLSIPVEDRYRLREVPPERRRRRAFDVLLGYLKERADQNPLLALIEDAQWMDPSSQALVGRLVAAAQTQRVLIVITSSPDYRPAWIDEAHVRVLVLDRLSREDAAEMVNSAAGAQTLANGLVEQILSKARGLALLVEELTRTLIDFASPEALATLASGDTGGQRLAIPDTLTDCLRARLEHLAPVSEIAQIAAAIGPVFSYSLLAAVAELEEYELRFALERLVDAGLIIRRGGEPENVYAFKHALVHDAVYESTFRATRRALHGRIARTLEARGPTAGSSTPAVIAHHYAEAGLAERAVGYWRRAGAQASAQAAHLEAVRHLERALASTHALPEDVSRARLELSLRLQLAGSLRELDRAEEACAVLRAAEPTARRYGLEGEGVR